MCHSKSGDINPVKIRALVDAYVAKFNRNMSPPKDENEDQPKKAQWYCCDDPRPKGHDPDLKYTVLISASAKETDNNPHDRLGVYAVLKISTKLWRVLCNMFNV